MHFVSPFTLESVMVMNINGVDLQKIRRWCRAEYNKRRETEDCHPSHTASDVMQDAERKWPDLSTFGVEGWCDECGREGVSYLNTGDTYDLTICFHSGYERFSISSWGDAYEAWERKHGRRD